MKSYFDETPSDNSSLLLENKILGSRLQEATVPVVVNDSAVWDIVDSPNRFMRKFEFENFPLLKAFVEEVLDFQEEFGHHGQLTIQPLEVIVEVYTHGVNDITELDQKYVVNLNQIYRDIQDFSLSENRDFF
jgi:pterin-4a-carbinolamine dehydratase